MKSGHDLWFVSLFTGIKKKGHGSITFGDKGLGKIISIEKIGKDPSNSIDNIHLVDGLKFNILSITQPCDKGNLVTFDSYIAWCKIKKIWKKTLSMVLELKMSMQLTLMISLYRIYHVLELQNKMIIGYGIRD